MGVNWLYKDSCLFLYLLVLVLEEITAFFKYGSSTDEKYLVLIYKVQLVFSLGFIC